MRIHLFTTFFPETELQKFLAGAEPFLQVDEDTFAKKLFEAPGDSHEAFIRTYLECIQAQAEKKDYCIAGRLFRKFDEQLGKEDVSQFSEPLQRLIETVSKVYEWSIVTDEVQEVGEFPESNYILSQFAELVKSSEKDVRLMTRLETHVECHVRKNLALFHASEHFREVERKIGYPINVIQADNSPKMVVVGTPRTDRDNTLHAFFKKVIDEKVQVIVALNTAGEYPQDIAYYEDVHLSTVDVDGWKAGCIGKNTLYCGKKASHLPLHEYTRIDTLSDKEREIALLDDALSPFRPAIIERTLKLTHATTGQERTLTHLHYKNWPDNQQAPDLEALWVLAKRHTEILRNELMPSMLIHCFGGIGRTNCYALLSWVLREIEVLGKEGKPLADAVCNIPKMMFRLKQQAPRLGGTVFGERFVQIYAIADRFFKHVLKDL